MAKRSNNSDGEQTFRRKSKSDGAGADAERR